MPTTDMIRAITDPNGDTHCLHGVLYGTCSTKNSTQAKVVSIPGIISLSAGLSIRVSFTNAQSYNGAPTLNVNSLGAKTIYRYGTTKAARYEWAAGEIVDFVYNGSGWVIVDSGVATTSYYGITKLTTSGTSTSADTSLTPAALNNYSQNLVTGLSVYSASATYAVGDRCRYGEYIYECNTAISTAEAWNANHWTQLPSLLAMIDNNSLPAVTSSDDGKVLRVVNGEWAAAQLPSANGVSF